MYGNPMISENYVGIPLYDIVENEDGFISYNGTSRHLLILNLKTGQGKITQ